MLVSQISHARISIAFEQLFFCVATIRNDIYARPYPGTRGNSIECRVTVDANFRTMQAIENCIADDAYCLFAL